MPRSVFDETKYLEIVIVIDHSMVCKKSVFTLWFHPNEQKRFQTVFFRLLRLCSSHSQYKRHKSKKHTRNFAKSVVNLVDAVSKLCVTLEK